MAYASSFDPALYPKTYRASIFRKIFMVVLCAPFMGLFALLSLVKPPVTLLIGPLTTIMLGLMLCDTLFTRIILYPDRIERLSLFIKPQVMRRDEIARADTRGRRGTIIPVLVSEDAAKEVLWVDVADNEDAAWKAWMEFVPGKDVW